MENNSVENSRQRLNERLNEPPSFMGQSLPDSNSFPANSPGVASSPLINTTQVPATEMLSSIDLNNNQDLGIENETLSGVYAPAANNMAANLNEISPPDFKNYLNPDFFISTLRPLSWPFSSMQTKAKLYESVLSGGSTHTFVKKAVDMLEKLIKRNNILTKTPYGIVPRPTTYSYKDSNGTTITKPMIPTGSPNDYISLATYWWPDPNAANGLPYILFDGKTNPESNAIPDQSLLRDICKDVQLLGLAYFFTKKDAYANKAVDLLRAFFLDPATRMNPHFKYNQVIQGWNNGYGRSTGFVDAEVFPELLNGYQMLQESAALAAAPDVDSGLKAWFRSLWQWMTTEYTAVPAEGTADHHHYHMMKEIKKVKNNIRSAYELQVLSYAQFIGEDAWVVQEINRVIKDDGTSKGLISKQILPDAGAITLRSKNGNLQKHPVPAGTLPVEMRRTKPATYCQKNINLLLRLGGLAENAGVDIWNYVSPSGSSIKKAIQAIIHFTANPQDWPCSEYEDIAQAEIFRIYRHSLRRASGAWPNDAALQSSIQDYLKQLNAKVGPQSFYSETAYRKGIDWQILIHKLGYNF